MTNSDFSDASIASPSNPPPLPRLSLLTMFRLGCFQLGLGMMSVLVFGVLNRILIKELGVPATIATIILALSLFIAPARVWFGQLSDTKPLWGYHRTGYVIVGAACLTVLVFVAVQVMWQVGSSLRTTGWTAQTYLWLALLAIVFTLYGLAVAASSTPYATLLVDVSDEDNRSKLIGIDWSMLILGTIIGGIAIGVLLKQLPPNAPIDLIQAKVNHLFLVMPAIVFGLVWVSTWGIEKKYSRYAVRSSLTNQEERITLGRAWRLLTESRQTQQFFLFLMLMTLGLFIQDPVLEAYGAEVFKLPIGAGAVLNSFWGIGTLVGLSLAGFVLVPRLGKRTTARWGCLLVVVSLFFLILAGITHSLPFLQGTLLAFGVVSGITTTGALSLMLDLTAAETAGTFMGAWGLAQALARGLATVSGGAFLDLGKTLFSGLVFAYGLVFVLQAIVMLVAIWYLNRVSVQEFRTEASRAIAAVLENELD